MTGRFDVSARLAEGSAAVDDAQTLVLASHLRGYQHPDLTAHRAQVQGWYTAEDGLDLGALDADCAVLQDAARSCGDALRIARGQLSELARVWSGDAAGTAADFVEQHCAGAGALSAAVDRAAAAAATLRDDLWAAVDAKAEATVRIIGPGQRSDWIAAARTMIAGGPSEDVTTIIDTQVRPFVEHVVQGEWLPAMQTTAVDVTSAYRSAVAAIDSPPVRFAVPGDLGPPPPLSPVPSPARDITAPQQVSTGAASPVTSPPTLAPPTVPGPATAPAAALAQPEALPEPLPATSVPAPAAAPLPAPPSATGGLPDFGSAAGVPGALGGLLGSALGLPNRPKGTIPDLDMPEPIKKEPNGEFEDADAEEPDPEEPDAEDPDTGEPSEEEPGEDLPAEPELDTGPEPPTPAPAPSVDHPATPAEACGGAPPPPVPATPCEIAADELPQVGA